MSLQPLQRQVLPPLGAAVPGLRRDVRIAAGGAGRDVGRGPATQAGAASAPHSAARSLAKTRPRLLAKRPIWGAGTLRPPIALSALELRVPTCKMAVARP